MYCANFVAGQFGSFDIGKYHNAVVNSTGHVLAPSYLAQSVRRVADLDRRRLRSSSSDDVIIPTTRLVTVGDRANSLPPDIRSAQTLPFFCNRLKTYLFSECFPI